MIVHVQLSETATLSIGVTDEMQQDLIECQRSQGKNCAICSWAFEEYGDKSFCIDPRVIEQVVRENKNGKE